ncbi:aminotransferase class III-fold pyridoxal phosphate-dependent enzyme [bacterium]|nr:aminotransferase class III-fold pyridoxal phosphate-dependent enzyme [bacterium]
MSPLYFERAEGPYLFDVDGNRYVDFCLSFGPHLLGHSHPKVVEAINVQVKKATSFGACHPLEVELAEKILGFYPFLDKVRLVNSGTEAVMTAVRVARGFTGRSKILVFDGCYHGHSDGLLAKAGSGVAELAEASSGGVPSSIVEDTLIARLDDFTSVEKLFQKFPGDIAAILMEPIPANYGLHVTEKELLQRLSAIAKNMELS